MNALAAFLEGLGRVSLQGAILVLLVVLVQRLLATQLAPRWRCALWLVVMVRLVLPVSVSSVASIFNVVPKLKSTESGIPYSFKRVEPVADESGSIEVNPIEPPGDPGSMQESPVRPRPLNESSTLKLIPWPAKVFALWLAGALTLASYITIGSWRMTQRFSALSQIHDPGLLALLEQCRQAHALRGRLLLAESPDVTTPALYGFFGPKLLLPPGFAARFSASEMRFILLHEIAHVKRRDIALNWLASLLQIVHWFNPLVWFGFSRWRADRELACDALALDAAGPEQNRDYGRTILRLLEGFTPRAAVPGVAGILEDKRQLRLRIDMIANHIPDSGRSRLALLLTGAVAVAGLTDAQSHSESTITPNASQQKGYEMNMSNSIANAGVIGLLALSSPTASTVLHAEDSALTMAASSQLAQNLIGTWILVGEPGKVGTAPKTGGRYKFFTGTHWCITQADPDNGVVIFHHGGSYRLDGDEYIETVEFANPTTMDLIGKTGKFKINFADGLLTDIGIGDDNPWREVWKRVENKSDASPLARDLAGTWVLPGKPGKAGGELRRFKFITGSSWCDTESDPKTGVVIILHGGVCTLKGNRYVERIEYANPGTMNLVGHSFQFGIKLDGNTLNLDGIGNPWKEVWKRAP